MLVKWPVLFLRSNYLFPDSARKVDDLMTDNEGGQKGKSIDHGKRRINYHGLSLSLSPRGLQVNSGPGGRTSPRYDEGNWMVRQGSRGKGSKRGGWDGDGRRKLSRHHPRSGWLAARGSFRECFRERAEKRARMLMSIGLGVWREGLPPGRDWGALRPGTRVRDEGREKEGGTRGRSTTQRGALPSRPSARTLVGGRMASSGDAWRRDVDVGTTTPTTARRVYLYDASPGDDSRRRAAVVGAEVARDVARESSSPGEDGAARPVRLQELRQQRGGERRGGDRRRRRWGRRLQSRRCQDHPQCRASHRRCYARRRSAYVCAIFPRYRHPIIVTTALRRCLDDVLSCRSSWPKINPLGKGLMQCALSPLANFTSVDHDAGSTRIYERSKRNLSRVSGRFVCERFDYHQEKSQCIRSNASQS